MTTLQKIEQLANEIDSQLHTIKPIKPMDHMEITQAYIDLANMVHSYEGEGEEMWYLGEHNTAPLVDLLVGGYWHFTDWHAGQDSLSYEALCAIGSVYSPNMSSLDDDNYAEKGTYDELALLAGGE